MATDNIPKKRMRRAARPSFAIQISSVEGVLFEGRASSVELHGQQVTFLILPNQSSYLTFTDPSRIVIRESGRESNFHFSGMMSVQGQSIRILSGNPTHETKTKSAPG